MDPWTSWVLDAGRLDAFPYGLVMYFFFLPTIFLYHSISPFTSGDSSVHFLVFFSSTILAVEFALFKVLNVFRKSTQTNWAWLTMFSPLVVYISYVHGQIDIIPTFIFFIGTTYILNRSWGRAGLAIGLAIAAKFSFVLVLPFFLAYFVSKRSRFTNGVAFIKGMVPGFVILIAPIFYSAGYREMVLSTPEVIKSLDAKIDIGVSSVFLVPIAYLLVFLIFWNLSQISSLVLTSFLGIALIVIALTQVSSVGWFFWGLPLILLAILETSVRMYALVWIWQLSICTYFILQNGGVTLRPGIVELPGLVVSPMLKDFVFTLNLVIGTVLIIRIISLVLNTGDVYKIARRPLSITISGDSGVGKDTLSHEIASLFGDQEVSLLLGDDYHLHERHNASWLNTTHLSPDANDLEALGRDFKKLLNRERIMVKHYDHSVGRFSPPRKIVPAQIIIVNGLHAQLIPGAELADLQIFLSMSDDLRNYLKVSRDYSERSQTNSAEILERMAKRVPDYLKFIEPQSASADIEFRVSSTNTDPLQVILAIRMKDMAFLNEVKVLINSVLSVPSTISRQDNYVWLEVDPNEFKSEDAYVILRDYVSAFDQLFPPMPKFSNGSIGLMGLVSVLALARKRKNNA